MKKTSILSLLLVVSIVFVSCGKKEKDIDEITQQEHKKEFKENFNLQIVASSSQKDDFALYFTEDKTIDFNGENVIWSGIKGGNIAEVVNFELQDRIPTNIRLDFGMNKEQDSVTLNSIKVNFYDQSFEFKGSDFFAYFIESKDFKYKVDSTKGTITLYKNGNEYKTPFFYPTQLNNDKVKEITTSK